MKHRKGHIDKHNNLNEKATVKKMTARREMD